MLRKYNLLEIHHKNQFLNLKIWQGGNFIKAEIRCEIMEVKVNKYKLFDFDATLLKIAGLPLKYTQFL